MHHICLSWLHKVSCISLQQVCCIFKLLYSHTDIQQNLEQSHWNYMYIRQNAMNHLYVLSQKLQYSATSLFTEQKISSAIIPEQPIQRAFQPSWVSKDVFWYLLQIHCHKFQVPRKGRPSHSALEISSS